MNYEAAEKFALDLLSQKLDPRLLYHNLAHTQDVIDATARIAASEKVSEKDLLLLKTAAAFHDTGFTEQYEKNEPVGCRIAKEHLPRFGYLPADIEVVCGIIMATDPSASANHLLHEIIRDADLDYVGRDDFFRISGNYRKELQLFGTSYTDKDWYLYQMKFMESHYFNTLTSKAERQTGKLKNMEQLRKIMKLGQY